MNQPRYIRNFDADSGVELPVQDNAIVKFFNHAKRNNQKSEAEGRAIFDNLVYVEIRFPGDNKTIHCRQATDQDKIRFPGAWKAFELGEEVPLDGTPLEQWPQADAGFVAEMKALGIRTVEQLASMSDGNAQNIRFGGDWVRKAQAYIAGQSQIESQNEDLKSQLEEMQAQLAQLTAAQAEPKKKAPRQSKPKQAQTAE